MRGEDGRGEVLCEGHEGLDGVSHVPVDDIDSDAEPGSELGVCVTAPPWHMISFHSADVTVPQRLGCRP
ncbi:hypothetical protein SO3561_05614 [Streptomyces olivochromogenes]|uniref:Uncharacterized protein n=1 Tax=Streptomyces olivochromogenes TaxID=1963 RepID=A0A250VJA4_STROL|nr:hypothetical protein SO3561_05614 [Streptomyces olivochromogenes]